MIPPTRLSLPNLTVATHAPCPQGMDICLYSVLCNQYATVKTPNERAKRLVATPTPGVDRLTNVAQSLPSAHPRLFRTSKKASTLQMIRTDDTSI